MKTVIAIILVLAVCMECSWLNKAAAFKVSNLASNLFVAGRDITDIKNQELAIFGGILKLIPVKIDWENKIVSARGVKAVYREGLGVALNHEVPVTELQNIADGIGQIKQVKENNIPWPKGNKVADKIPNDINKNAVEKAINFAFQEPPRKKDKRNTRGVVVVYKGNLIAERYAADKGFYANTRQVGNSMTKSLTNTLVGLRVKSGDINVEDTAPVKEWSDEGDPRNDININHLLQMSSGLSTEETADIITMVYCEDDMTDFATRLPLSSKPGTKWYYSSLSSMVLSGIVRQTFNTDEAYWDFPRKELFERIGMTSAILETDAAGTFIGSSFLWATPKDWARFGQLYLQNGMWEEEQILPENWVDYTTTTAPASDGRYGAHFWLNKNFVLSKDLPEDTYQCRGLFGQQVTIIPSKELVIVRFGFNTKVQRSETNWLEYKYWTNEYSCRFYKQIIDAIGS